MDDRQPLLNASSKSPIDDDDDNGNKKQLLINSFFDWCRRFSKKGKDNKYIKLDDDTEHSDKDEPVGVFRLFRFANRMDFVLMFIAACLAVVDTICALVIPVLFGRLTGIFVTEAFSDNCDYQHQNSITSMKNNNTYLQAIELNIFNNDSSYKLRHTMGVILSSTLATSVPLFREKIMNMVYWLFKARGAAASVFRLIDEGNDASVNEIDIWKEDTEAIYNINGDIEFDNINFSYLSRKDVPVLRNLSLIARAGQTTALVGSSGSGKSTCISLFLRYYEPSSGRIMIDGRPITDYNVKQLRQNIGVVSQEPILFGASIYENIRFGKVNATQAEIEQAAREANAHNFIMQLP
ncbi:unnamed protein product, partial [Rotaria sp. Silwood1]